MPISHNETNDLDVLAKHPGSFDRDFWEESFIRMHADWRRAHDIAPDDTTTGVVSVHTRDGGGIAVAAARVALTWGQFFADDGSAHFIPFSEITRVVVSVRPTDADPPSSPIGFDVTRIDEE
jgi:hypothetical protein